METPRWWIWSIIFLDYYIQNYHPICRLHIKQTSKLEHLNREEYEGCINRITDKQTQHTPSPKKKQSKGIDVLAQISTSQITCCPGSSFNKRNPKEDSILFLRYSTFFLWEHTGSHFIWKKWNMIQHVHHNFFRSMRHNLICNYRWSTKSYIFRG